MSTYTPDRWVLLRLTHKETIYKVLAGWSGGYLYGSSWKLNSGCVSVTMDGDYYIFSGHSGSTYRCHKNAYGLTIYTADILAGFQEQAKSAGATVETVDEATDFLHIL